MDAYLLMKTLSTVCGLIKEKKAETVNFLLCLKTYDVRQSL